MDNLSTTESHPLTEDQVPLSPEWTEFIRTIPAERIIAIFGPGRVVQALLNHFTAEQILERARRPSRVLASGTKAQQGGFA